jgi:hypothetical protein
MGLVLAVIGISVAVVALRRDDPATTSIEQLTERADVIAAVVAANAQPPVDLKALDGQWRREVAVAPGGRELVQELMARPLSRRLAIEVADPARKLAQVMIMDSQGALVAADHVTHDFDQSDEPKWQKTAGSKVRETVFESSEQGPDGPIDQLSRAITRPDGAIIGAVTIQYRR